MLALKNISVSIQDKKILSDISLDFILGKNYCILGQNGSGKSSLAMAIMGHPSYEIQSGDMTYDGNSILALSPNERANLGIFLAFQSIPEIKGVKVFEFLRTIYSQKIGEELSFVKFKRVIVPMLEDLGIDKEFLRRDLNVGFSGGERRKLEVLQIKLLTPTIIILDEVDSGLDVDAFRIVANLIKQVSSENTTIIVITHLFTILEYIPIDTVYVFAGGKIKEQGGAALVEKIKVDGFNT